ncbi:MAG: DUF3307 domain-containing protein [Clostridium sp.]|nr:DUF3307 domain-containing protein [Clostridium sp.]
MFKVTLSVFLIGHFLGDFYLQTNKLADSKEKSFKDLLVHSFIYLFSIALIVITILGFSFLKWAILVSLIHFFVDLFKFYLSKNNKIKRKRKKFLYILDQLIHIITILIVTVRINYMKQLSTQTYFRVFQTF